MRITSDSRPSPFTSALKLQPTPQYAQVVFTARSGWPSPMIDFSVSAAVGQDSTQAPHETHSESRKGSFWLAETFDSKPRPWMVRAKVPCTSSQARTQREQTMHSSGLKLKYGVLSSLGCGRCISISPFSP